ncbi:MAG: hypothetical protein KH230_09815 [Enterocloster asparagiformis]|nr:hypothetical protein [Enterocloster asparagiformis]
MKLLEEPVVANNVCISYIGGYAIFMNEFDDILVEKIPQEAIFLGEVKRTEELTPLECLDDQLQRRILQAIS